MEQQPCSWRLSKIAELMSQTLCSCSNRAAYDARSSSFWTRVEFLHQENFHRNVKLGFLKNISVQTFDQMISHLRKKKKKNTFSVYVFHLDLLSKGKSIIIDNPSILAVILFWQKINSIRKWIFMFSSRKYILYLIENNHALLFPARDKPAPALNFYGHPWPHAYLTRALAN